MLKNLKDDFKSCPGSRFRCVYERQVDENGEPTVVVKDKINQYEEIQTYKDDNNIYKILSRLGNDISKLDFNKGVYIDVSQVPDNYNDFMNINSSIRSDFDALPVDFKRALKNNFNLYYGLAMNGTLKTTLDKIKNGLDYRKELKNIDFKFNNGEQVKNNVVKSDSDNGGDKNV